MKAFFTLSVAAGFLAQSVAAQNTSLKCGHDKVRENYFTAHPEMRAQYEAQRAATFAAATEPVLELKTTANGPIPVIFHIVLTAQQLAQIGGAAGVAERVDSSIAVLNRDYNRRNSDSTIIPSIFKPAYANMDIQFGLARRDPNGAASLGYEIITTTTNGFDIGITGPSGEPGSGFSCSGVKYGPADGGVGATAWDNSKYLNIWVCNITPASFGILGVASPPSQTNNVIFPLAERGVVVNFRAFGKRRLSSQSFISGIDGGRTLVHELGHFFELEHVFGTNELCPNGGDIDDGIADTPPQDSPSYFCPPVGGSTRPNSCSPSTGRMYVNFMDYSDDACLVMFTNQQGNLMRAQVQAGGPSVSLTQNPVLTQPLAVHDVSASRFQLSLSPNPARGSATIVFDATQKLQSVIVMDATGRAVRTFAGESTVAGAQALDLAGFAPGLYTVRAQFEEGAGLRKLIIQ